MVKLLVLIDGSDKSIRATQFAIRLAKSSKEPMEAHLLNVQLPVTFGDIAKYVSQEALNAHYQEEGMKVLKAPRDLMVEATVPHTRPDSRGPHHRGHQPLHKGSGVRPDYYGHARAGGCFEPSARFRGFQGNPTVQNPGDPGEVGRRITTERLSFRRESVYRFIRLRRGGHDSPPSFDQTDDSFDAG